MIYEKLFDWQKKLVDTTKDKSAYGLFLDMGLGKTPISLALCEQNKVDRLLIITINSKAVEPAEQSGSWLDWASKSDMRYKLLNKKSKALKEPKTAFFDDSMCLLVNYEYLFTRGKLTKENPLRESIKYFLASCKDKTCAIIVDESHKMKDSSSAQTKAINTIYLLMNRIAKKSYIYLLTGTPFTKGYIDLYTQLKILGCPMTKAAFKDEFCIMGNFRGLMGWQQPIVGYKNVDKLFDLVHQYAITIESKQVIQLPEQVFSYHTYKMTDSFKLFLTEKLKGSIIQQEFDNRKLDQKVSSLDTKINNPFFRNIDYPEFDWMAETPSEFWLRARELAIGFQGNGDVCRFYDMTRLEMLKKFLQENEDNYLLFYSFTPELIRIYNIAEELGYNIDLYTGEFKSLKYYNEYSRQPKEKQLTNTKNIIISNWKSGSTGLNLQAYNKCIIFDLPVYRDWQQGLKRIHRTGQGRTCIYHVFMQNCFLDKGMLQSIKEQQDYTKDTFESDLRRVQDIIGE